MTEGAAASNYLDLAAEIVSAYVSNNSLPATDLPQFIATVHQALASVAGAASVERAPEAPVPAIPIKKSITPDHIVCLEDGRKFKSLKRHLRTAYGMTPEAYRAKWGLPYDYPMVAPNYAQARSDLAKSMGLGQSRKSPSPSGGRTRGKRAKKAA